MNFRAYILRCSDGSYYAGHTDDLEARVGAHQSGLVEGYTQKRRPVALVWSQEFAERDEAFRAERQIKGWSRAKKEALIRGDWDAIQLLSRKLFLRSSFDTPPAAATQDERPENHTNPLIPNGGEDDTNPLILSSGLSDSDGRVSKDERRA